MSKMKRPLRLWHGVLAMVAALAVGAAGTAIAGGGNGGPSKGLTTAGFRALRVLPGREDPLRLQVEEHPRRRQPERP